MKQQVDKSNYQFSRYCGSERWASYWQQLKEIFQCQPASVLEIGPGDKVVANYLAANTEIKYSSLDIAADLKPDIVASVSRLPLADSSFDLVCAFEVLEHLPFSEFGRALGEMKRVSRQYIIISLPHWGRHFSLELRLPYFKRWRWQFKFSLRPIEHQFDGQHYWEIGKRGYPLALIKRQIEQAGLLVKKDYIAFASPYHHFFILAKEKL